MRENIKESWRYLSWCNQILGSYCKSPLLKNHHILGNKSRDFEDFVKVAELMENKAHLTLTGMDEIRKIKAEMNTGRKLED